MEEEVDINLNDPQVGEAAKKIQNVFRCAKQFRSTLVLSLQSYFLLLRDVQADREGPKNVCGEG
ncbi:hypothetical protein ANCDUO_01610 [Ancylostoma duodenale]|uniref:Uncharacterized protein n=1 Tax=Ancylostoma duodenale TaxID=51022 RepID=A0A0C2DDP8_9BILA|nr:hypothetical protein ANCDUO_01610 [Ancylostoma duodenale]